MSTPLPSGFLDELRTALRPHIGSIAGELLGRPCARLSNPRTLRYGRKGSLVVHIGDERAGTWFDFERGIGGDCFALLAEHRGFPEALQEACVRTATTLPQHQHELTPEQRAAEAAEQEQRAAQRATLAAKAEAKRQAEDAARIAAAQTLWAARAPIDGSPAETYLTETRRIPKPVEGWPACIAWHPNRRALIAAATTTHGALAAVQEIRLTPDGRKRIGAHPVKQTTGRLLTPQGRAAVRLPAKPGADPRQLLLGEGLETALSVWAAHGAETWAALGSGFDPQPGRLNVVAADDDAPDSARGRALAQQQQRWREQGLRFVLGTPYATPRGDKSDFNDLLRTAGPDAVRARIAAAIGPLAEESLTTVRRLMADGVRRWLADEGPRHLLLAGEPGTGKSYLAHQLPLAEVARRKAAGLPHRLILFVPDHQLAAESRDRLAPLAAQANAAGLTVSVLLGFGDVTKPVTPNSPCQNLPAVMLALGAGLSPKQAVCGPTADGDRCGHFAGCRRVASHAAAKTSDIVIAASAGAMDGHHMPAAVREGLWRAIFDEDVVAHAVAITRLGLESFTPLPLERAPVLRDGEPDAGATAELAALQARLVAAIDAMPDDYIPAQALREAGLRVEDIRHARALTWDRKRQVDMRPGQPLEERRQAAAGAKINGQLGKIAGAWHALEDILTGGAASAGRIRVELETDDRGQHRTLILAGLKPLASWLAELPILLLDGAGDIDRVRRLLPTAEVLAVPRVAAPHERRHLILGSFGSSALTSPQKQADLLGFVTAATALSDAALLVTHKCAVGAFTSPGFDLAVEHHGAIAGRDGYRHRRNVFVTAARSLPAKAAAELAAALTGEAVPIASRVPVQSRVQLRDGSSMMVTRSAYADPRALAAHDSVYWTDQAQACRGRGLLRTAETPLDTFIFASAAPPDMVFDTVARWAEVRPDVIDQMLQAGAVYTSPTHAAMAHPKMFTSPKAAEHCFSRAVDRSRRRFDLPASMTTAQVIGWRVERQATVWGQAWTSDTYQRAGQGHAAAAIFAPVGGIALARKIVAGALGPLSWASGWGEIELTPASSRYSLPNAGGTSPGAITLRSATGRQPPIWPPVSAAWRNDRPPDG